MSIDLLIDNIDSKTYGFKYLRKEMGVTNILSLGQDWLRNSLTPIAGEKRYRYTPLTCYFLFNGSQDEFEICKSVFIQNLQECTLKFSDMDLYYDAFYDGEGKIDSINPKYIEFSIKFNIYSKYKPQVTELANRVSSKTINVEGNLSTPAIIEITPSISLADITIFGLGDAFTVKNLSAGQKIVINGENCTVVQNGVNKFGDFDGWEFPKFNPGTNTITFSKNSCDITIKYKPKWI